MQRELETLIASKILTETEIVDTFALRHTITDGAQTFHDVAPQATFVAQQLVTARAQHNRTTFVLTSNDQLQAYIDIAKAQHVRVIALVFNDTASASIDECYTYDGTFTIERLNSPFLLPLQDGLDVIGDIHGCYEEMITLIEQLGYREQNGLYIHPTNRKLVSVGDVMSRGPQSLRTLQFWLKHIEANVAYMTDSNHGYKIGRWLAGHDVTLLHGDELVEQELALFATEHTTAEVEALKQSLAQLLLNAPSHYVITSNNAPIAIVTHAGIKDHYINKQSKRIDTFCRFGDVDGHDEFGRPIRKAWYNDRTSTTPIIWGHVPHIEPTKRHNTINIDQGVVFGGQLTAFRLPENEFYSINAKQNYVRAADNPITHLQQQRFQHVNTIPYDNGFCVSTKTRSITIGAAAAKKALLQQQTFKLPPLPAYATPPQPAKEAQYIMHPAEVLNYYEKRGVREVVMQQHISGERALIFIAKDRRSAKLFLQSDSIGTITDEHGEAFLLPTMEQELLQHMHAILLEQNYFEHYATKYILFEAIISPFNAYKKSDMLAQQEAATNEIAGRYAELQLAPANDKAIYTTRLQRAVMFEAALHNYSWPVSLNTIKIAPVRLVAHSTESFVNTSMMTQLNFAKALSQNNTLFVEADYKIVDVQTRHDAIQWWEELSMLGHVGVIITPLHTPQKRTHHAFVVYGRDYLRLLYGIDYTNELDSLKKTYAKGALQNSASQHALFEEWVKSFVQYEQAKTLYEYALSLRALQLQQEE